MIYFDNAATTPVHPEVAEVINHILLHEWGNPSSLHHIGFEAEKRMREAGRVLARGLGVDPSCLIFTSCASESNNTALWGAVRGKTGVNVVMAQAEHSSVEKTGLALREAGVEVRVIPVDWEGFVAPDQVAEAVDDKTALVTVMQVNNELGSRNDLAAIGPMVKAKNPKTLFHVDGTQAFGKLPVKLEEWKVDSYSASAHKIHGPKGVGLLYVRQGVNYPSLIAGGGQMGGRRAGTENVAYICAMAKAYDLVQAHVRDHKEEILAIYHRAMERIRALDGVRVNSPTQPVNPYIINFGLEGVRAEVLLHMMEGEEMYFSSGSACSKGQASPVIEAIGVPDAYKEGILRISFAMENSPDQVDPFFDALEKHVREIRKVTGWSKNA